MKKISDKIGFTELETKVSLFILAFFIIGLAVRYFINDDKVAQRNYDYSKIDSSFFAINFEARADSASAEPQKLTAPPAVKININNAGADELIKLPGIGIKTAEKIIEYRKKNGLFPSTRRLMDVKGISSGKFDKIKDYIAVK